MPRCALPDIEQVSLLVTNESGQAFTAARPRYPTLRGWPRPHGDEQEGRHAHLVFGASAAYGECSARSRPSSARPKHGWKANPEHPIEALNLAHGGMGSRQVSEMVFRALENDNPDLIVVYTGNNEYHELRALKARPLRSGRDRCADGYPRATSIEPSDALMPAEDARAAR